MWLYHGKDYFGISYRFWWLKRDQLILAKISISPTYMICISVLAHTYSLHAYTGCVGTVCKLILVNQLVLNCCLPDAASHLRPLCNSLSVSLIILIDVHHAIFLHQVVSDKLAMVQGGAVVTDVGVEHSGVRAVPADSDTMRGPR